MATSEVLKLGESAIVLLPGPPEGELRLSFSLLTAEPGGAFVRGVAARAWHVRLRSVQVLNAVEGAGSELAEGASSGQQVCEIVARASCPCVARPSRPR